MLARTSILLAATMAASAIAHTPAGVHRRELVYQLRQMAERAEIYPSTVPPELLIPTCDETYDTVDQGTGLCSACGPGRVLTPAGLCTLADPSPEFAISAPLQDPQPVGTPITWDAAITGEAPTMNVYTCASICSSDAACTGFYFLEGTPSSCWKIGGDGTYDSTDSSFPFVPTPPSKMAKRAPGTTGTFLPGGQVALATSPDPNNPTVGCITAYGDAPQDTLTCNCGAGRINDTPSTCRFAGSAVPVRMRKVRRDGFEGVPW